MINKIYKLNTSQHLIDYSQKSSNRLSNSNFVPTFRGITLSSINPKNKAPIIESGAKKFINELGNYFYRIFKKTSLPQPRKPIIVLEDYSDLVHMVEEGNDNAKATLGIVKNLLQHDFYVDKTDNLFTSEGLFRPSVAHEFADGIIVDCKAPSSLSSTSYGDGKKLLSSINEHIGGGYRGCLDEDIDYLDKLSSNKHFDSIADRIYSPEQRFSSGYERLKHIDRLEQSNAIDLQERALDFRETQFILQHPELANNDPIFMEKHPELAHLIENDNINDKSLDGLLSSNHEHIGSHLNGNVHSETINYSAKIGESLHDLSENISSGIDNAIDGTHQVFDHLTSHLDMPEFELPKFDFDFHEILADVKDILADIWDLLT